MKSIGDEKSKMTLMMYGFSTSLIGNIYSPFLSIFIFEIAGGSFLRTGLGSQLPSILSITMGYIWAFISDTTHKRKMFIQMALITGIFTTFCLSYVWSIEQFIAIQLIGSLTGSAGGSAFSALLAEVLKGHRGESLGKYNAFTVIGGFFGNIISGILYNTIGFRNMLKLIAALNVIPLILISIIPENQYKNWSFRELNWRNIIPRIPRGFWSIYPLRLILTLPGALSGGILGIYYLKYLGGSPESWSIVIALTTLLGITTIPYGKLADKLSVKHMFTFAGLGWTILYFGYYISPTPIIFALFFIIPIWPAFWITYSKCLMELSDKTERAKFYAFEGTLSTIYGNIIGIISGYLADIFGPREMFLLSSTTAIIATIYINLKLKI